MTSPAAGGGGTALLYFIRSLSLTQSAALLESSHQPVSSVAALPLVRSHTRLRSGPSVRQWQTRTQVWRSCWQLPRVSANAAQTQLTLVLMVGTPSPHHTQEPCSCCFYTNTQEQPSLKHTGVKVLEGEDESSLSSSSQTGQEVSSRAFEINSQPLQ